MSERSKRGYFVEIAEGGPWLAQDGTVALDWDKRGTWKTKQEARKALAKSLAPIKQQFPEGV